MFERKRLLFYLIFILHIYLQDQLNVVVDIASQSVPNELEGLTIDTVLIYGLNRPPKDITKSDGTALTTDQYSYVAETQVAKLVGLNQPMTFTSQLIFHF